MRSNRLVIVVALTAFACGGKARPTTTPTPESAPAEARLLVNVDAQGIGLGGHDPVAYVTEDNPIVGRSEYIAQHGGAKYQFTSTEHKATFEADGKKYAPQYGGYCAFAASENRLSEADPTVYQILDGQLLVFTNQQYKDMFNKDARGNKQKADANWPGLVARYGKPITAPK